MDLSRTDTPTACQAGEQLSVTIVVVFGTPLPRTPRNYHPHLRNASNGRDFGHEAGQLAGVPETETGGPRQRCVVQTDRWAKSVRIGCFSLVYQTFFTGAISEVLVYRRVLNETDRNRVRAYLICKWQLQHTAFSIRGRSYYRVFLRFPGGRQVVEKYLNYLQREGVDWERSARQGYVVLERSVRQFPVGTETAIVQFLVLLDKNLQPVPTHFVELVHLRIFKNVDGVDDPRTSNGRGVNIARYTVRRRLLFDGLKHGGFARSANDAPTYRVLMASSQDWGVFGRQQSVAQTCLHCHMYDRDRVGVRSLNSISCFVAERGMPGIIIPMGSGDIHVYSRGERTVRWKLGQEDYARLVEYARADRTK